MERATISGKSPAISAVVYDKLKGVDFSSDPGLIAPERSPFAPNLMSGKGGFPEKRPGWRTIRQMNGEIFGLHAGRIKDEDVNTQYMNTDCTLLFSLSVRSNFLRLHGLRHTMLP